MTNREHLNRASNKVMAKFLVRHLNTNKTNQCMVCMVKERCEENPFREKKAAQSEPYPSGLTCAERIELWLGEEAKE